MTNKSKFKTRMLACIVMVGGLALVFSLLIMANSQNRPPAQEKKETKTVMSVKPKKKAKKKKAPRPKPKRRVKPTKTTRAPLPNLSSSISGVDFGLPQFDATGLDEAQSSALGKNQSLKNLVMTEDAVDEAPRPLKTVMPEYPARARAKGVTGSVTLKLLIGTDGQVERVKVVDAAPSGVFDEAAVYAAKQLRFQPARYRGENVKIWARKIYNFNLS